MLREEYITHLANPFLVLVSLSLHSLCISFDFAWKPGNQISIGFNFVLCTKKETQKTTKKFVVPPYFPTFCPVFTFTTSFVCVCSCNILWYWWTVFTHFSLTEHIDRQYTIAFNVHSMCACARVIQTSFVHNPMMHTFHGTFNMNQTTYYWHQYRFHC